MNMDRTDAASAPHTSAPANAAVSAQELAQRWHELVTQISEEIASPLTFALERIYALTSTGKIDRAGLRALREEVEQARQVGMVGQQIMRLTSGRVRLSNERIKLTETLQGVLTQRGREVQARGLALKPTLKPVEVLTDASLLFGLLNALIDWALTQARSGIELKVDIQTWSSQAQIVCAFERELPDPLVAHHSAPVRAQIDSLAWRLLEQTARTMALELQRRDDAGSVSLTLGFPHTVTDAVDSLLDDDAGFAPSSLNSRPLAGSHVLVIATRRELRLQIRDALRDMGLVLDFVNTLNEAVDFCRDSLPHAIVIESIQASERFAAFRQELLSEVPHFVFIEIMEEGHTFEMSDFSDAQTARVGRDLIDNSLSSALMFELSKTI
jgi:CheY-like chemotaxis protein